MKKIYLIYKLIRKFMDDNMPVYAASASFWILISSVPFLMLIITAIQFIPGLEKETVQMMLIEAAPNMPQFRTLITSVTDNLYINSPGAMISVSALLTIWSASTGVYGIEKGIRNIYGTNKSSSYIKMRLGAMVFTFLFIVALLLTLLLMVLGSSIQKLANIYLPFIAHIVSYILNFKLLITICILFISFMLIYRFMPGKADYVDHQYPGALFVSLGWVIFSFLFSIYFTYFKNISYMYGSLGALVLLMFWIFAIICMVFFGAEINAFWSVYKDSQNNNNMDK